MHQRQTSGQYRDDTLPKLWLLSDARNDTRLEHALRALPGGSGFVFRHYHLPLGARHRRFAELAALARACGHVVVLSGSPALARAWEAQGVYGAANAAERVYGLLCLATAHDGRQITLAAQAGADAVFLSPVFPTRSHPDSRTLGPERFRELAACSPVPVIALGGMTAERARELDWPRWGAIDGLAMPHIA